MRYQTLRLTKFYKEPDNEQRPQLVSSGASVRSDSTTNRSLLSLTSTAGETRSLWSSVSRRLSSMEERSVR